MGKTIITNMIMLENEGKILVINRVKKYCGICFPGGKTNVGESVYDSAIREFREETGLDITNLESKGFIYFEKENNNKYFTYFYKATKFSGCLLKETEEGKTYWMTKEELKKCSLAPNMEKYLKMFENNYTECFCSYKNNYKPIYR